MHAQDPQGSPFCTHKWAAGIRWNINILRRELHRHRMTADGLDATSLHPNHPQMDEVQDDHPSCLILVYPSSTLPDPYSCIPGSPLQLHTFPSPGSFKGDHLRHQKQCSSILPPLPTLPLSPPPIKDLGFMGGLWVVCSQGESGPRLWAAGSSQCWAPLLLTRIISESMKVCNENHSRSFR